MKNFNKNEKLFIAVAFIAASAFGVFQANQNNNQLSELQMENAELLAQGESASYGCRMVCHYNPYWYCDIMYTSTGYTERCPDSYPN